MRDFRLLQLANGLQGAAWLNAFVVVGFVFVIAGCNGGDSGSKPIFVTIGTAPSAGAFAQVGNAISSTLEKNKGEQNWKKVQSEGTSGSQENIRQLDKGEFQLGMSNSAISYNAVRGTGSWDKKYDIRAVVTIAANIGLFLTKRDSGIKAIGDLKGKRVAVGPPGAGFEMFLGPLLTEHGVTYTSEEQNFTPINARYADAVQQLGDGTIDAAFVGGAIPTPAVVQACSTFDVHLVEYDEAARQRLIENYDYFQAANIPAKNKSGDPTYKGMGDQDFKAINVGSMQLITHANVDEEFIYQITKRIWEHRADIAKQHKAGNAINERNAARFTGTEFHPGAVRFYKEIGIWPESGQ